MLKRLRQVRAWTAVLVAVFVALGAPPAAIAGWDKDKPATSDPLDSSPVRGNFQSIAASQFETNVLRNGEVWDWSAGTTSAPDGFVLSGAACTIVRTGTGEGDTFTFGAGRFTARVTRAGTNCKLTATIINTTDMTD